MLKKNYVYNFDESDLMKVFFRKWRTDCHVTDWRTDKADRQNEKDEKFMCLMTV